MLQQYEKGIVLKEQNVNIEELLLQKKELEQSISYASYIQKALFPEPHYINFGFQESFVFFKPRDIVSGDFYWINQQYDKKIIAVGDCTGHGVPGAFLSILGISFLDLVVSKYNPETPAELLNYLREYIMKSLNQCGEETEQKDGIDLSVCFFSNDNKHLCYSGSFNSLYIVREKKLIQLEASKMPVGVGAEIEQSFINQCMELQTNDMVYLYSDGFPDQFGGVKGKKYKYQPFRNLMEKCSDYEANLQKLTLENELKSWMGTLPQLDDITILGLRV